MPWQGAQQGVECLWADTGVWVEQEPRKRRTILGRRDTGVDPSSESAVLGQTDGGGLVPVA